MKKTFIRFA